MYSCGPPHMDVQEWDDQHELTYSSYVRTRDVTLKTCLPEAMNDREKWRETVRDIRAGGATWWWWWYIYIYLLYFTYEQIFLWNFVCWLDILSGSLLFLVKLFLHQSSTNEDHHYISENVVSTDHLISARRPDLIIINKKKKREFVK